MERVVAAEMLDGLAADDPAAQRSRRDLRRVHRAMGTRSILLRGLADLGAAQRGAEPLRVLELGAGDGTLMLGVAKSMARPGLRVQLTLLDRQALLARSTIDGYLQVGWAVAADVAEVADWIASGARHHWDAIVTNLFLHHFVRAQLVPMLGAIAARTDLFFACEPRRGWIALAGSHLVGALGANAVTREDAVLSVRAGFAGAELSALWPEPRSAWRLREYRAGLFSHCLCATRIKAH